MKQIPMYFDCQIIDYSPIQQTVDTTTSGWRIRVGAFTKYTNRNGSYITDEFADHLIESATRGNVPVVGFYDKENKTWSSHTGPTLARAYGYVESFLGWEPMQDTDGKTRDYAVFSVVLFTDYYEEANDILGKNQSMELDVRTIQGDWASFDGIEYYVYTQGEMLGFCVIGEHEPCFSVSAFFSNVQFAENYNQFTAMVQELKNTVVNYNIGGEAPMDNENMSAVEEAPLEETVQGAEEAATEPVVDSFEEQPAVEEQVAEEPAAEDAQESEPAVDYAAQLETLQHAYDELQHNYEVAQARISELEQFQATSASELESVRAQNTQLQTSLEVAQTRVNEFEVARRNELINSYSSALPAEEIEAMRASVNDLTYEELESKLAIQFAHLNFNKVANVVPTINTETETPFAKLMKNYRKG